MFFPGVIVWSVIIAYIAGIDGVSNMPALVWGILGTYIGLFLLFPVNMGLQYANCKCCGIYCPWNNARYPNNPMGGYYFGEKGYQILSLLAKSSLQWLIFAAIQQPNKYV